MFVIRKVLSAGSGVACQVLRVWGKSSEEGGEHQEVEQVRPANTEGLSEQAEAQPVQRLWDGSVKDHWRDN